MRDDVPPTRLLLTHQEDMIGMRQVQSHSPGLETNEEHFHLWVFLEGSQDIVTCIYTHVPGELNALVLYVDVEEDG